MRIPSTVCLCVLLSPAAFADSPMPATQAPAAQAPGEWLVSVFGQSGLESLKKHGYVIVQGKPGSYRLQKVSWKALETLSRNAQTALEFSEALPRLKAGESLAGAGPLPFLSLRDLPPTGLMTPPLHMLLDAMAAYHEGWTTLAGPTEKPSALPASLAAQTLFDMDWGKPFADRIETKILEDPEPVVNAYADFLISGVQNAPKDPASLAAAHFIGYFQDRYQVDVSSHLAADIRLGLPSEELRGRLKRYLAEQHRLNALRRLVRAEAALEKKTPLAVDLAGLAAVAAVFRDRPALLTELEGVVQTAPPPSGAPELTGTSLHLQKPVKLGQYELGDAVTASGAYWIDALPSEAKVEVEETTYLDNPDGFAAVESRTVKRANGGPYAFERRLILKDSTQLVLGSAISAPSGNVLQAALAIPVAKDFELAVLKLAQADSLALACDFEEAQSAYAKLEAAIADAAREKPQYADILKTSRKRRAEASRDAALLFQLKESAAGALQDSSPDQCRYDLKRVEEALALARSLPAGCENTRIDLSRRRQIISRRAADQQAFARASDLAASRRQSCDFSSASQGWAEALAILDADTDARCGKTAQAAASAKTALAASRAQELWRAAFAEDLRQAQTESTPAKRLDILESLIARIGSLPQSACFSPERKKAEKLAQEAGTALAMPDALVAKTPADSQVSAIAAAVAAQRRKLIADATALEHKKAAEQSPAVSAPLPPSSPPGPRRSTGASQ